MKTKPNNPLSAAQIRNRELAAIHTAKRDLALPDDVYRDILEDITGQRSAAKLNAKQRKQVLDHLRVKGWQPKRKPAAPGKRSPASRHQEQKTRVDKIRAIWISLYKAGHIQDGSETALLNWVRKQTDAKGTRIDALEWLENTDMANTILEQLKQWQKRLL